MASFCTYTIGQTNEVLADTTKQKTNEILTNNTTKGSTLINGVMVELDLASFAETLLISEFANSYKGHVQINLKNKFYPVAELGIASAAKTTRNNISFATNGFFGKIGVDLPIIKPLPGASQRHNVMLGGVRLGMSQSKYSLTNQVLTDPYWGGAETINERGLMATKWWIEATAGIRASIYKNFFVGWNVRYKYLLNSAKNGAYEPWYIPGYGRCKTSLWGFSYIVGYRF